MSRRGKGVGGREVWSLVRAIMVAAHWTLLVRKVDEHRLASPSGSKFVHRGMKLVCICH